MTMIAIIIQQSPGRLLVRDIGNNQDVLVHFRNAGRFNIGDRVRIIFSGRVSPSTLPQITAVSIQRIGGAVPEQPEIPQIRGLVLQIDLGFLMVWDVRENRLVRVEFPNPQLFRPGQNIIVRYNAITLDSPPRVTATTIVPT